MLGVPVTGRKNEGYAQFAEPGSHRIAFRAVQIDVEYRAVRRGLFDGGEGMGDGSGKDHLRAQIEQHVFQTHRDDGFVFENQNGFAGPAHKTASTRHSKPSGAYSSCACP